MNSPIPDDIPFGAILSIINRGRFVFLNDHLRPLGLSAGQFPVLMLLYKEQNITQDTLVRHYHLDKGTIARAVKKLEAAGYIRRIVDPTSRRAVRLFLTEKGVQVIPRLKEIYSEWDERVFAGLSGEEKDTIEDLMHSIAKNSCRIRQYTGGLSHADS
ncbi:MarR family transcriptional regulator [uncultured Methanoregula sp.]|uniref:MarR family winged helix-turn-helix transcriptional regulator n=1 Tax=uncultured Methanoregula sp. TaxID=1005933 RepID=UPI002AAB1A9E|nr:MarR family transcriptional regulator [uncultured Methanoregula sp.]